MIGLIDDNSSGKLSFSNVGILPAIIAGLDVKKIYSGALQEFENKTSVMIQNINLDEKVSNKLIIPDFYDEKSD